MLMPQAKHQAPRGNSVKELCKGSSDTNAPDWGSTFGTRGFLEPRGTERMHGILKASHMCFCHLAPLAKCNTMLRAILTIHDMVFKKMYLQSEFGSTSQKTNKQKWASFSIIPLSGTTFIYEAYHTDKNFQLRDSRVNPTSALITGGVGTASVTKILQVNLSIL